MVGSIKSVAKPTAKSSIDRRYDDVYCKHQVPFILMSVERLYIAESSH